MIVTDNILDIKAHIVTLLETLSVPIEIINGFYTGQYFGKVENPFLSVCLTQIKTDKSSMNSFLGNQSDSSQWYDVDGEYAFISFGLTLFTPMNYKESHINGIFLEICQKLLFDKDYDFCDITTNEVAFDEKLELFTCKMNVSLRIMITKKTSYAKLEDFVINASIT